MAAAITAPPCRVRREATQPMRSMFVSRSSFEKPRPFERCCRTESPSRYSTTQPRRSSSGPITWAIVDLPDPERPVNQRVKPPSRTRSDSGCSWPWMFSVIRSFRRRMDAAFELVGAGPAACALLLLRGRRAGAGDAADRAVAGLVQRVVGDLVDVDVGPDALLVPVRERVQLPDAVALRPLDLRGVGAARGLVTAGAGGPGLVRLEHADERLDLADLAAAVGVPLPEVGALAAMLLGDRDHLGADEVQPVALDQSLARLVALAEEELRVELDDVDREVELRNHVHEDGRLLLPRAGQAEPVAELLVAPDEQVLGCDRVLR